MTASDPSVPLTAEAIHNLCKDWPANAWPDGVRWKDAMPYLHRGFFVDSDGYHIRCHLAAALFRDSGLRWLSLQGPWKANAVTIQYGPYVGGDWKVNDKHFGKTDLLEAISAAINAARKEGENV